MMSIIGKLTVGAMAVLGAYALKGKRDEASGSAKDKPTAKRAKPRKAAGKTAAAKRAAPKAKARVRSGRRTAAKTAQTA